MTEQEIAKAIKKQFGNVDKNQSELLARAYGLSEGFFYADDDCAWEPFEDWPEEYLSAQVHDLAENIYHAMLWAQKKIIDGPEK